MYYLNYILNFLFMSMTFSYKIMLFMLFILPYVLCSDGDRSPFFVKCLTNCRKANCTVGTLFYFK